VQAGTHRLVVTASIGAIAFPPADAPALDLEHAIARADAALYRAKREGRDRAMRIDVRHGEGTPPCVCATLVARA
jgi:GGDEF domain-containing protein